MHQPAKRQQTNQNHVEDYWLKSKKIFEEPWIGTKVVGIVPIGGLDCLVDVLVLVVLEALPEDCSFILHHIATQIMNDNLLRSTKA